MNLSRKNMGLLGNWWWTIDRKTLFAICGIMLFSALMVPAASPAVAEHIGLDSFYFVRRQLVFLCIAACTMFSISLLSPATIKKLALIGLAGGIIALIAVLFVGYETKGAKRWLHIAGISIQPSEFIKPFFIVATAWLLTQRYARPEFPTYRVSIGLYALLVILLLLQPDFGMTATISAVWAAQLFLGGLPLFWIPVILVFSITGIIGAYIFLPHVASRIDGFLHPANNGNYQVQKSLQAFSNGGFFGKGPGEGVVKQSLPDSHTDFIFAVIGEELGILVCILLIGFFAFIVIRGIAQLREEHDLFITLSATGLLMLFGIQTIINMGVTLNLLPTKGMTLPFISYGGSSLLAMSITMGMLLALTRKRYGIKHFRKAKRFYI